MLKTLHAKLLAVLAALGLSAVAVTVGSDGCTVKPVTQPVVDAGSESEGE